VSARLIARGLLLLWLALFAAIAIPWGDFQDHTHWYKVGWIPFASAPLKKADIIRNVVAFIPFGALIVYAGDWRGRWLWPTGIVVAILLSAVAESAQLYSHMRFPSATDVTANAIGAALGIWIARYGSRLRRQ
jgi:glycopeptide antibiotics resistance protein